MEEDRVCGGGGNPRSYSVLAKIMLRLSVF